MCVYVFVCSHVCQLLLNAKQMKQEMRNPYDIHHKVSFFVDIPTERPSSKRFLVVWITARIPAYLQGRIIVVHWSAWKTNGDADSAKKKVGIE